MTDTIFTKIINGEVPAYRVYEDDDVLGILDIHPAQPGHTLMIVKKQVEQFTELDKGDFRQLMEASHKFANHMQKILGCHRVALRIEGFDVPHVHVHLIPCETEHDSYKAGRMDEEPDHAMLRKVADRLAVLG